MKSLYFDCFSGASGNMLLGALLDLGADEAALRAELAKLKISDEFSLKVERVRRGGLAAVHVNVKVNKAARDRKLSKIKALIKNSGLDADIKKDAIAILGRLGEAEAAVHGRRAGDIHLHELSGVDTVVDIVGVLACMRALGAERVECSPVNVGSGTVECAHGTLPVPAPATAELLKGAPVYSRFEGELTTPTGALLLTHLAGGFGPMPEMRVEKIGCGAGTRETPHPNVLRAFLGEAAVAVAAGDYVPAGMETEFVCQIKTNLDDLQPEVYTWLFEKVFEAGALDFTLTPIIMKKNRPGTLLEIMCGEDRAEDVMRLLLKETTTLGLRVQRIRRVKLERRVEKVKTRFGALRVKIGLLGGVVVNVAPEYEDCAAAARASGEALIEIMRDAGEAARKRYPTGKLFKE